MDEGVVGFPISQGDWLFEEIQRLCGDYDRSGDGALLDRAGELARPSSPRDAETFALLGGLQVRLDNKDRAARAYQKAAELERDKTTRTNYLISALECYAECTDVERSLAVATCLLDEHPSEEGLSLLLPVLLLLPEVATEVGRHAEAASAYLVIAKNSDAAGRHELMGKAISSLIAAGSPEQAIDVARQYLAERPDDRMVAQTAVRLLAELGRHLEAVELVDRSLPYVPDLSWFGRAEANGIPISVLAGQRLTALTRSLFAVVLNRPGRSGSVQVPEPIASLLDSRQASIVVGSVCRGVDLLSRRSREAVSAGTEGFCRVVETLGRKAREKITRLNGQLQPFREAVLTSVDSLRFRGLKQGDVLYAFYDLAVSPVTFDVVKFLVLAEAERERSGSSSLHIVIVPGPNHGFRDDGALVGIEEKRWRLRNVVVPCCWLLPSCAQVSVCASRDEGNAMRASLVSNVFPIGYSVRFPKAQYDLSHVMAAAADGMRLPSLKAPAAACEFVAEWIQRKAGGRKVVTISLRECAYQQDRNSNLSAWGAFARRLDDRVFFPVIVRDIQRALEEPPPELAGLSFFSECIWNLELRSALYELSYLNMFVNMGPLGLGMLNRRAPYLVFKPITPGLYVTSEEFLRRRGFEPGSQLPFATPFQRWVWEDDRLEAIERAFGEMCERIDGAEPS